MIERDKPLSFHWRAVDETWIDDLSLPKPRSRKHDAARCAIIVDAALSGIAEPGRWISYSRRHDWWAQGKRYRGSAFTYATVPLPSMIWAAWDCWITELRPQGRAAANPAFALHRS